MIEFLIELRQYTVYLLLGLFGVAIISFVLLFNAKHKKKELIRIALLFITAFVIMGMNFIIAMALRYEIAEKAELALKNDSIILINGNDNNNVDKRQLLTDLSKINGWYFTNKSHPETVYLISIISQLDTLDILLKRDSKNAKEYWTYLPQYNYELELDLLETETLNELIGK